MMIFPDILKSLIILAILIWLIQILLDILKSQFQEKRFKWIWIALVTFLPVIGMTGYYFFGKRYKKKEDGK